MARSYPRGLSYPLAPWVANAPGAGVTFFSPVADRANMVRPATITWYTSPGVGNGDQTMSVSQHAQADYLWQWNPTKIGDMDQPVQYETDVTVQVGAWAAGPTGSAMAGLAGARKIVTVNDSSAEKRSLVAGWVDGGGGGANAKRALNVRFAAIAKAAEITRVTLQLSMYHRFTANSINGVRAVFDLAGGQIAIAPYVFGSQHSTDLEEWTAGDAHIESLGDGWYMFWMEGRNPSVQSSQDSDVTAFFQLDGGSGLGAEDQTITGDGTSGVYVWRTSVMPPAAWDINTRTFFDDFDDESTIDFGNTKEPGFNWYPDPGWPTLTPSGGVLTDFVIRNSHFTQTGADVRAFLGTAAFTGDEEPGEGFGGGSGSFDDTVGTFFPLPLFTEAYMAHGLPHNGTISPGITTPTFWSLPGDALLAQSDGHVEFDYAEFPESQLLAYNQAGTHLASRDTGIFGTQFTWGPSVDWTLFHRFSGLWLPADAEDDGIAMSFCDGILSGYRSTEDEFSTSDGHVHLIWLGGNTSRWDWFSVWGQE